MAVEFLGYVDIEGRNQNHCLVINVSLRLAYTFTSIRYRSLSTTHNKESVYLLTPQYPKIADAFVVLLRVYKARWTWTLYGVLGNFR